MVSHVSFVVSPVFSSCSVFLRSFPYIPGASPSDFSFFLDFSLLPDSFPSCFRCIALYLLLIVILLALPSVFCVSLFSFILKYFMVLWFSCIDPFPVFTRILQYCLVLLSLFVRSVLISDLPTDRPGEKPADLTVSDRSDRPDRYDRPTKSIDKRLIKRPTNKKIDLPRHRHKNRQNKRPTK